MEKTDILIVGAGAVGLAVARELSFHHSDIVIVERHDSFGKETSSRNSEVVHAGMYYPAGTLKAKLCVEGRELLYELCEKQAIPYQKTGKLIVATEKEEIPALEKLHTAGEKNGVKGLSMLNAQEIKGIEPNVAALAALYSPETGIVDSHRFMQSCLDCAKDKGALAAFDSEVKAIEKTSGGYKVSVKSGGEVTELACRVLINSAGLESDSIAAMVGMDTEKLLYRLHYCKGRYFRVRANKAGLVRGLVYPVPRPKSAGLGIHATKDLGGGLRLGPDDEYMKNRNQDYSVDNSLRRNFYASARQFMPFLEEDDLDADTAGIRPKLQGPGEDFRDFVIREESQNGFPGLINLIGIESPGLTASLAIARYVKRLATSALT